MGHVFEVDQPTTQSGKRRRMAELGWTEPPGLHFVPVDLSKESLSAALARGSFDTKAPAFFSWLGVIHYLERDAVLATMRSIAEVAHPGSELVFDYFEADAFVREKQALRVHFTLAEGERVGEPLKGGARSGDPRCDPRRRGLATARGPGPSRDPAAVLRRAP